MNNLQFNEPTAPFGHTPAIICGDKMLSYRDLQTLVIGTATRLKDTGCKPGNRVGICLLPDWKYVVLILALLREGAIACPISIRLPIEGLKAYLDHIQCTKLLASPIENETEDLQGIELLNPEEVIDDRVQAEGQVAVLSLPLSQPATIIFTSGSSGRPKAVLHTYGNHYFSALGSNANIPLGTDSRWLLSLPLYHVSGLSILFRCMLSGAAVVVPHHGASIDQAITDYDITHISMVSTQLIRMMRSEREIGLLGKLQAILLGGSAIPTTLLKEAYERQLPIHVSYGLTEMASQVTTTARTTPLAKRYTSGKPLQHREVKIGDDGEILVRGKTLFAGYVEGSKVVLPVDHDRWFATGDLGYLDEDGYLTVIGRKDNMFISGGENIQPEEIEAVLLTLDEVEQAIVVPRSDAEWGARPVAFIRSKTSRIDADAIVAFLEAQLPRFKIPVAFYEWPTGNMDGIKVSRSYFRNLALKYSSDT